MAAHKFAVGMVFVLQAAACPWLADLAGPFLLGIEEFDCQNQPIQATGAQARQAGLVA